VDFLQGLGPFLYSDEVRARFDLVSFDPRGVARSTPLQCFETTEDALAATAPFPFPYTRAEERVWIQSDRAWQRACAERGGPILNHMSTANVARDMDLLSRAVGDRKMTYVGYSYGTAIGSTYANMFPDKVRAVVIDGVIDPVSYTTGRGDQARTLPSDARLRSEQGAYDTLQGVPAAPPWGRCMTPPRGRTWPSSSRSWTLSPARPERPRPCGRCASTSG
jgi:pimeloyl-ACP methyl ester carboxylesterase